MINNISCALKSKFPFRAYLDNPSPYINVPFTWEHVVNLLQIDALLNKISDQFQAPIKILNGFRTEAVNNYMHGNKKSSYLRGSGVMISAADKMSNLRLVAVVAQMSEDYDKAIFNYNDDSGYYESIYITISDNPRHLTLTKRK